MYKAYKDDFTQARPRGRPPKRWSAQIREDTGLPLLTLERRALNRGRWRGNVRLVNARGLRKAKAAKSSQVIHNADTCTDREKPNSLKGSISNKVHKPCLPTCFFLFLKSKSTFMVSILVSSLMSALQRDVEIANKR